MKSKLLDLAFFVLLLLIFVYFGMGFEDLGPVGWSILGAIVVAYAVVEFVFDFGLTWLMRLLGVASGKGPLTVTAVDQGGDLLLTLTNDGKTNLRLVAIAGRDQRGKTISPTPYEAKGARAGKGEKISFLRQVSAFKLSSGDSIQIFLDKSELASLGCQSLSVIDTNGGDWPVQWQMQF